MAFTKEVNLKEWHEIRDKLTNYLGICKCQRKLKSIINVLVRIYDKGQNGIHDWTAEEYLILAMLDARGLITHGINCEYPIILHMNRNNDDFWEWIKTVKDNPNLDDN